ncbi:hypothetical protein CBL_00080 [Carabus blaptoides fortunei]
MVQISECGESLRSKRKQQRMLRMDDYNLFAAIITEPNPGQGVRSCAVQLMPCANATTFVARYSYDAHVMACICDQTRLACRYVLGLLNAVLKFAVRHCEDTCVFVLKQ